MRLGEQTRRAESRCDGACIRLFQNSLGFPSRKPSTFAMVLSRAAQAGVRVIAKRCANTG